MGNLRRGSQFVKEVTVIDPDSKLEVELAVFKHQNGGMFAIDSSFIVQCTGDDDSIPDIPDTFETNGSTALLVGV